MVEQSQFFRKILIPSDGTQVSVAAGRVGIQMALVHKADVVFSYIVDMLLVEELASSLRKSRKQLQDDMTRRGQQYLNTLTIMAQNASLLSIEVIRAGIPYAEIESLVREMGIDLIVMGVGHKKTRGILIGDVTQRVIENAACPVLVVK